jgi:murein DD-endopeptidase MepM/ murein hydrolase activator NlpD
VTARSIDRRLFLAGAGAAAAAGPVFAQDGLHICGQLCQSGYALIRTRPRAEVKLNGQTVGMASAKGVFVVGFDRDEPATANIEVLGKAFAIERDVAIAPRAFDEQRIDGLPQDQVAPSDPALLERIKREAAAKAEAFASRIDSDGFKDGFDWPVQGFVVSGRFGNRRILNGEPKRPHYGIDLACAEGTVIHAPADGLVVFARPDMHFEGGLTLIDHGQGLIAAYLHQSAQSVVAGQRVTRGQAIGKVGHTGRATGPHLCWRLKWRDRNLDPSLWVLNSSKG